MNVMRYWNITPAPWNSVHKRQVLLDQRHPDCAWLRWQGAVLQELAIFPGSAAQDEQHRCENDKAPHNEPIGVDKPEHTGLAPELHGK